MSEINARSGKPTLADGFRGYASMFLSNAYTPEDRDMVAAKFDDAAAEITRLTAIVERQRAALDAAPKEAHRFASYYPDHSDGHNTFTLLAELLERRAALESEEKP